MINGVNRNIGDIGNKGINWVKKYQECDKHFTVSIYTGVYGYKRDKRHIRNIGVKGDNGVNAIPPPCVLSLSHGPK